MLRLTYVSVAVPAHVNEAVVRDIVRLGSVRNLATQITGGLIFTGHYFAQTIEGSEKSVLDLISSIQKDPRHSDLRVIRRVEAQTRLFHDWGLAYAGIATYITQPIEAALNDVSITAASTDRVVALLVEFGKRCRNTL